MPIYAFGPFILDLAEHRLTRDGRRVAVSAKAWHILMLLVEAGGRLVPHETFLVKVWPNGFAERLAELERSHGWRAAMADWIAMLERTNRWMGAAMQWMAVDEPVRALDDLERCVIDHFTHFALMLQSQSFRALQGEPRFQRVAQTFKLDGRTGAVAVQ